jgi:hypothetical protein
VPHFAKVAIFRATIVAFNAKKVAYHCQPTFFFATTWQIRATNAEYHCHNTFIFATYLNGGKSFSGPSARCPLRLATSRKGLKLILSELY